MTHIRRKILYDPKAKVPIPPKHFPITKRQDNVEGLAKRRGQINPLIEALAKKSMERLEKRYAKRGALTIRVMQALSLDKWAAAYADHLVQSIKLKDSLPAVAKAAGVKLPEELPNPAQNPKLWAEMEKVVWEHGFDGFMRIAKKRFKNWEKITRVRKQIDNFTSLPEMIYTERNTHWRRINQVVQKLLERKESPEKNLSEEIKRINAKHRTIEKTQQPTAIRLAAIDVVMAASIYADLKKAQHKEIKSDAEGREYWSEAYSEAMTIVFPRIAQDHELTRAILGFKKMSKLRQDTRQLQLKLA